MPRNRPISRAKTAYGLLSEVRKLILAEPLRYDQSWWLTKRDEVSPYRPVKDFPTCGTVGCVAGWVVTLKGKRARGFGVREAAQRMLGLGFEPAETLFDASAARGNPQTLAHARSGAAHIARFQKKYADQLKRTKVCQPLPKPSLKPPFAELEAEMIRTFIAGHKQWRPDLDYPESHSDMQAGMRALLKRYEIVARAVPLDWREIEETDAAKR